MTKPLKTKKKHQSAKGLAEYQAEAVIAHVRGGSSRLDVARALDVAGVMTNSLEGALRELENGFADAVREAANDIQHLRTELSSLGMDKLHEEHIPAAGQELDAVVEETEKATDRIMESAEAIMAADRSDPEAFAAMVDTQMIDIFEACTFQDITGQRIGKVVETLQRLESRFDRLLATLPVDENSVVQSDEERVRDERAKDLILNGPQIDGPQVNQNDIDALFD
ncbi:MAG: protein phosphatase CheZ [Pseudomonadota bacterium]